MKKIVTETLMGTLMGSFILLSTQGALAMARLPRGLGVRSSVEEEANEAHIARGYSAIAAQEAQEAQALAKAAQSLAQEEAAEADLAAMEMVNAIANTIGQEAIAVHAEINKFMQTAPAHMRNLWNKMSPAEQIEAIKAAEQLMAMMALQQQPK